jgi:hypothetical protein
MRDDESAQRLARDLVAAGVGADDIRIGREVDEPAALRAEMAAQTSAMVMSPPGAVIAQEGRRTTMLVAVVGSVAALLVCIPIALIDVGLVFWQRYLLEAGLLMLMVLLISYMIGGSWAWNDEQSMAAEEGVVVRVSDNSSAIAQIVVGSDPIRVDEVSADGRPIAAIHTESDDI